VYTWQEAVNHIGENATVTGPIINSADMRDFNYGDYIVLGMGKIFGEQGYVGIALKVDRTGLPSDLYIGKTISATSKIYRNIPSGAAAEITDLS